MNLNPKEIRNALLSKGVELGPRMTDIQLTDVERELHVSLNPYLTALYREFNGFKSYYQGNHISIWSSNRIVSQKSMSVVMDEKRYFAIGHLLIDSDFVMCSLERKEAPVFLLHDNRYLSPTVDGFFDKLIHGDFDF
jgi:hypothetical protein